MKTPMNFFNTAMKKKNKNRKGFSLVELIVVLVIMAILAAALVPSLMGYIKKTKQQNVNSEAQSVVQAAQTIASGAYASADGKYTVDGYATAIVFSTITGGEGDKKGVSEDTSDYAKATEKLAEVPTDAETTITLNADGRVTKVVYKRSGCTVTYELDSTTLVGKYTVA